MPDYSSVDKTGFPPFGVTRTTCGVQCHVGGRIAVSRGEKARDIELCARRVRKEGEDPYRWLVWDKI